LLLLFRCFFFTVLEAAAISATTDRATCRFLLNGRVVRFALLKLRLSGLGPVVAMHSSSPRWDFVSDPLLVAMAAHPWLFCTDCLVVPCLCYNPMTIVFSAIVLIFDFLSSQPSSSLAAVTDRKYGM
jgi:hypothetical protein